MSRKATGRNTGEENDIRKSAEETAIQPSTPTGEPVTTILDERIQNLCEAIVSHAESASVGHMWYLIPER